MYETRHPTSTHVASAARADEPVHASGGTGRTRLVGRGDVHLPGEVLTEAEDVVTQPATRTRGDLQLLHLPQALLARLGHEQRSVGLLLLAAVVAEDVVPGEPPQVVPAVDVAAHDHMAEAAAQRVVRVLVLDHRVDQRIAGTWMAGADAVGAVLGR